MAKKTKAAAAETGTSAATGALETPRMLEHYLKTVQPALGEALDRTNPHAIPRLEKIVINMGVGEAVADSKKIRSAVADLAMIAGQKPIETKSRKSIATFKLRDGMTIGAKVTLRRERMYEFIDRLTTIALPRVKDFRGLNGKSFDGRGNFAMGLKEHTVFPEISYDNIETIWGMDIIVCTTARTNEEAKALLTEFGFPFRT